MSVTLKPIIPKNFSNPAALDAAINQALTKTLTVGKGYFERTTASWQDKPKFVIDGPQDGRGSVGTNDDIYGYVTRGTRPHLIAPKNASVLSWEGGKYKAVTSPGVLGSKRVGAGLRGTGGVGQAVFAKVVHHPGTKARAFEEAVAKMLQPVLVNNVTNALMRTVK